MCMHMAMRLRTHITFHESQNRLNMLVITQTVH